MSKLPSFQFYPGDWMKDPALRAVSVGARGLWIDMLCLMFESDRRGYLVHMNGNLVSSAQLARMTGCAYDEVEAYLKELQDCGVFSRTKDGIIFSRRIERDERKRQLCSEAGKRGGGNPAFKGESKGALKGVPKGMAKQNANSSSSSSSSSSFLNKTESVCNAESVKISGEVRGNPHTHSSLLDYFQKKHIEKRKRQTNIFDVRLDPKAQALMRTHGRELAFQLVDRFFDEDRSQGDKWLEKADYSFNVFSSQAERLVNDSLNNSLDPEERIKRIEALVAERERNERIGVN